LATANVESGRERRKMKRKIRLIGRDLEKWPDDIDESIGEKRHKDSDEIPLEDTLRTTRLLTITDREYIEISSNDDRYDSDKWYEKEEKFCYLS
jgi:hypothetical protein